MRIAGLIIMEFSIIHSINQIPTSYSPQHALLSCFPIKFLIAGTKLPLLFLQQESFYMIS